MTDQPSTAKPNTTAPTPMQAGAEARDAAAIVRGRAF